MGIIETVAMLAPVTIGSWFGGFFGTYLRKKGENLATKEDIDDLVEQTRQLTQATKEIEAKISHEVWDRQRKWEVKKEALFDAARGLVELNNALMQLSSVADAKKNKPDIPEHVWLLQENEALKTCMEAANSLQKITLLLSVTVGPEVLVAFGKTNNLLKDMSAKMSDGDFEGARRLVGSNRKSMNELILEIRAELGVD
jgi:hypothetical protein